VVPGSGSIDNLAEHADVAGLAAEFLAGRLYHFQAVTWNFTQARAGSVEMTRTLTGANISLS
jgi:hypothetical protein